MLATLDPGASETPAESAEAIVILSGDAKRTPNRDVLDPGPLTMDLLRSGASLHRRTGLPVAVSGGRFSFSSMPLAEMMARSLKDDFRIPVRWEEDRSRNTWENASLTAAILEEAGVHRIYLVTHAWHMRRSLLAFRRFWIEAIPASVRPSPSPDWSAGSLMPSASAWENSYYARHEWLGLAYYWMQRSPTLPRANPVRPPVALDQSPVSDGNGKAAHLPI